MRPSRALLFTLLAGLPGCTAGAVTRNGVGENGDIIQFFNCASQGNNTYTLSSLGSQTTSDLWGNGSFVWNPYSTSTTAINSSQEIPAGLNLVSVVDTSGNVYVTTINQAYGQSCTVLYDGTNQSEPCAKEIFELEPGSAGTGQIGTNSQYDAPIYGMAQWNSQEGAFTLAGAPPLVSQMIAGSCNNPTNTNYMISTVASNAAWGLIGIARPSWVGSSVDRRLRLLGSLPEIDQGVQALASVYILAGTEGPGLSVGLVFDDGLVYSDGFGYANIEAGRRADETTVYGVGSFTKVITGTSLLTMMSNPSLIASGYSVPEFTDPVSKYFDPGPAYTSAGATLRNLVSHTAGYPDEIDLAGTPATGVLNEAQWLTGLRTQGPAHGVSPASAPQWGAYSGDGVEAVGYIVGLLAKERAQSSTLPNEKSWELFVKNHILTPLGMTSSGIGAENAAQNLLALNWQQAWFDGAPVFTPAPAWIDEEMLTPAGGDGGLYTSVQDLAKFMTMWLTQTAPRDPETGDPIIASSFFATAQESSFPASSGSAPANCGTPSASTCTFGNPPNPLYCLEGNYGIGYSGCLDAGMFGVNWRVNDQSYCPPGMQCQFLEHNGNAFVCGSNTRVDVGHKIAGTGLISTNSYPSGGPSSMPSAFMDSVVLEMLSEATAADQDTTTWYGSPLGVATARLLYLTGAPTTNNTALLDAQFTPAFLSSLPGGESAATYVASLQTAGACGTFRVRAIPNSSTLTLRLSCATNAYDVTFTAESTAPYRIAAISQAGIASGPY